MKRVLLVSVFSVCALVIVAFHSCRREDTPKVFATPEKEITIAEVKAWYKNAQAEKGAFFTADMDKKIGIPDWGSASWQKPDQNQPAVLTVNLDVDFGGYGIRRLIFAKDQQGEINGAIMQCVGELAYLQAHNGIIDSKDFTGDIHFLNLSGRFMKGYRLKDAKITFELHLAEEASSRLMTSSVGETVREGEIELNNVYVYYNNTWTYMNTFHVLTMLNASNSYSYNYTGCNNCPNPPIYYYGGSGSNPPSTPPQNQDSIAAVRFDERVEDSLTSPCLDSALTAIKMLQNGYKIADIYRRFAGENPKWNWIVKEVPSGTFEANTDGDWACSGTPSLTCTVTSRFNYSVMQTYSDIGLMRTMIHEMIHAYLIVYFNADPTAAGKDYPDLLDKYYDADLQHQTMTQFIDDIAYSLWTYDMGRNYREGTPNLTNTLQDFKDLAWGGLIKTDASGLTTGPRAFRQLPVPDRQRIAALNLIENGKAPASAGTPIGKKKCQ